jgi:hypothetical protein
MTFGFVSEGEWVARCILADSSRWSAVRVYVHAFAMPLFLPRAAIEMYRGVRVGGSFWEKVDEELFAAIEREMPALNRLATLDGLVKFAGEKWRINISEAEFRLCVATIWRNKQMVEEVGSVLRARGEPEDDSIREVEERCAALLQIIEAEGFEAAEAVLAARRPSVLGLLV